VPASLTRLTGVLFAVLLSCNPSGTPGGDEASPGRAEATAAELSPTLTVRVAADTVTFTLEVANGGMSPVVLEFGTGQRYDFAVRDSAGVEMWRWSSEQLFTQALGTEAVEAGRVLSYEVVWMAGAQRGEYEAVGTLVSTSHPVEMTTLFVLGEAGGG
jgi:hypothetical protein